MLAMQWWPIGLALVAALAPCPAHAQFKTVTYFWRLKAAEIIKRLSETSDAEPQGEEFAVENFSVMRYRSTTKGESPAACFAFVAYAGHVDHSTGYRHSLAGIYCDLADREVTDARISELLGGIEADFG